MKKTTTMIRFITLVLSVVLTVSLCGCGKSSADITYEATYTRELEGTVLNVFNWGEYISDGSEGSLDVNSAFTELTGITVNYTTYESNEAMYAKLKSGGVSYDIIIPSDYMIERLAGEDLLRSIDTASLSNYKYIDEKYKGLYFDPKDSLSVPYCVGMVGLIYNSTMVDPAPNSWSVMWDEKYKNQILTFNNPRDAFAISQFRLGQDLNSTSRTDWDNAAASLKEQKKLLQSYVMDEVFQKMEDGEAAIAPYYAGDFLLMKENNPDLDFVYPKEGTNIFVDSVCIPKGCQNYEAAMMYINFLLEPEIALETAEFIKYATPHTAVLNNPDYSLRGNEYLYPAGENYPKVQYFHDIDSATRSYYEKLWEDVKLS